VSNRAIGHAAGTTRPQSPTLRWNQSHRSFAYAPETTDDTPPGPGTSDHRRSSKSWPRRHKILTAAGAIAALFVVGTTASAVSAHGSGRTEANNTSGSSQPVVAASASPALTATATTAPRSASPSRPQTAHKLHFPPRTLAEFRAFAATGDASQVRQVATSNEGLPSCPEPNIDVTVNRRLPIRTLQADLSAFSCSVGLSITADLPSLRFTVGATIEPI
jgi:hypothetical protein